MSEQKAQWFESYSNGITCLLCEHYCFLTPNQIGLCSNQKNSNGELETLYFGAPAALSITHIEDRPFLHVQPGSKALALGTKGCNMHCPGCQNHQLSQHFQNVESLNLQPGNVVKLALENETESIAYSYNEPVVFYPYAKAIGKIARDKGIKNLFQTAGLASPMLIKDLFSWADAVHVDLKSFNPAYYKSVLGGSLCVVKENLRQLAKQKIWLEVTTLVIDGINDGEDELASIAHFIAEELGPHIPWHVSAFTPANYHKNFKPTSNGSLLRAFEIGKAAGLHYVYFGNVPWLNDTRCPGCDTLLIQRREYEILENNLVDGCCPTCQRVIEGIWT